MKKLLVLGLLFGIFMFNACKGDDPATTETEYHINFTAPASNASLAVGDTLHVQIEFSELNGGAVHHINVRAYDKTTGAELFNTPAEEHVHQPSPYSFHFEQPLTGAATGAYILAAKVWGHDDGIAEVTDSLEFIVN